MSIRDLCRYRPILAGCLIALIAAFTGATVVGLADLPSASLNEVVMWEAIPIFVDRKGLSLNRTYQTRLNAHDQVVLYDVPALLVNAFISAEDSRFFAHHGVDWLARFHAVWQNMKAFHTIRGASTITEQVVRILFPRPRTYWSRWLEGWDAMRLEQRFSKHDILEFYLNQVPFSSSRRGIVQAARYYFGRSLDTLNKKETLALTAMVCAPSLLDPYKGTDGLEKRIGILAGHMLKQGLLSPQSFLDTLNAHLSLYQSELPVKAPHFLSFARDHLGEGAPLRTVRTTLDGELQKKTQELLDQRIADLSGFGLHNGAVLVVDHTTSEVLIWAVAGEVSKDIPEASYDAVRIPRQPGSTLKPFVYAMALDKGWSPATHIKDEPILEEVEHGLHVYRNFSQIYYGMIPLAEALGNSLNTPAVRTLDFVGLNTFQSALRELGVTNLNAGTETYGNGLILGNAEVSLLELVQAYAALARGGIPMRIRVLTEEDNNRSYNEHRVFSENAATTIGVILSEADFRRLEFGRSSILDFPVRTAVKTGTSTKGKDVWTVAYDGRFVVGIWLGNLDRSSPSAMITGAGGPALLARSVFAELRKRYGLHPLPACSFPVNQVTVAASPKSEIRMVVPSIDMEVLLDPRIPKASQYIPFFISGLTNGDEVQWTVDGQDQQESHQGKMMWPITLGEHQVSAKIIRSSESVVHLPTRSFVVK
ncbi:MAG: hypothetical protein BWK74_03165 [Desulfobacteraceae bacterium A6]|nr:MAG: hypothetical protein BWK74_03165 [Desulfobacteraceae bacterium A6]